MVGFERFSGLRPLPGPSTEDYRDQHVHDDPPELKAGSTALQAMVLECLYKAAGARPSPANLLERLTRAGRETSSGGLSRLREANLAEVARDRLSPAQSPSQRRCESARARGSDSDLMMAARDS